VHVPEHHTTRNVDGSVTEQDLPGEVYLYVNIDGGRVLLDRLHAGKVFEAQETAASESSSGSESASG